MCLVVSSSAGVLFQKLSNAGEGCITPSVKASGLSLYILSIAKFAKLSIIPIFGKCIVLLVSIAWCDGMLIVPEMFCLQD